MDKTHPKPIFCPYCGAHGVKIECGVPRCPDCRAVFFIDFSRYMQRRRTPRSATGAKP